MTSKDAQGPSPEPGGGGSPVPGTPGGSGDHATSPRAQEATRILAAVLEQHGSTAEGLPRDADRLLELLYGELRQLAQGYLHRERVEHTLQPTALVHEAWVRLIDQSRVDWQGRSHFLGIAAQAMRRILVDHARGRARAKRGGAWQRVEWPSNHEMPGGDDGGFDPLIMDQALEDLGELSERQAKLVELRFYGGLEMDEIATSLGVSKSTVEREWRVARAWLSTRLGE